MTTRASREAQDGAPGPHPMGERLSGETDLASRWLGGTVMAASDESFGDKENLLNPGAAAFEPGHYGNRGEIVDGWETRRRREPGHDWALIRLGAPGRVTSVEVDTSFFTGNYPQSCQIEACGLDGYPGPAELNDPGTEWVEIVPRSPLQGNRHNAFAASESLRFTHLRVSVFPDGGVARLRAFGHVVPDPRLLDGVTVDLASQLSGGLVVASSDGFYTSAQTLNRPGDARTMGEGWETRRRRDAGHDYVVFRLGVTGQVRQLVIDTSYFRYNASAAVAVYGCDRPVTPSVASDEWVPLLGRTSLQPDTRHVFTVAGSGPVAAVRLDAFPDGGLSRVRVIGHVDPAARRAAGYAWFNSLPANHAIQCLMAAGIDPEVAAHAVRQRPLPDGWIGGLRSAAAAQLPQGWGTQATDDLTLLLEGLGEGDGRVR
jgi:allantoicase